PSARGGRRKGGGERPPPGATQREGPARPPPMSHATPMMIGAIVVPSRAKKLKRPICSASPSVSCAISVCDPDQPNDSAPPFTICSSINGQNDGTSGKTGESAIAVHTKNSVTLRVPN